MSDMAWAMFFLGMILISVFGNTIETAVCVHYGGGTYQECQAQAKAGCDR